MAPFLFTCLLLFQSSVSSIRATSCPSHTHSSKTPKYISLVTRVDRPGTSFKPSTGKLLKVYELNNSTLRGRFTSHSNLLVHFKSTCAGLVHVWRANGSTIIKQDVVSRQRDLRYANVEDHRFVYKPTGKAYALPEHRRSRRDVEEEYDQRSCQAHLADQQEVARAFEKLTADPDVRILSKISQALAEFGIYGSKSPCSFPLHSLALAISRRLPANATEAAEDAENFSCAESKLLKSPRRRRSFWSSISRALGRLIRTVVERVVEPLTGLSRKCTSLETNRQNKCLGMCGKECNCWKWVCGNCCYNEGCYQHDKCCEHDTLACWLPTGFNCQSFKCWSLSEQPECPTSAGNRPSE